MPRKLQESNIEQFVRAFLSKFRHVNEKREVRPFIEKAIAQIDFFLNPPCCENPDATITFARRNNALTTYIHAILNNKFDKRKWRRSLLRARTLLFNFINDPCCHEILVLLDGLRLTSDNALTDEFALGPYTPLVDVTVTSFKMANAETHYIISVVVPKLGGPDSPSDYAIGGTAGATFVGETDLGTTWQMFLWNDTFGHVDSGVITLTSKL